MLLFVGKVWMECRCKTSFTERVVIRSRVLEQCSPQQLLSPKGGYEWGINEAVAYWLTPTSNSKREQYSFSHWWLRGNICVLHMQMQMKVKVRTISERSWEIDIATIKAIFIFYLKYWWKNIHKSIVHWGSILLLFKACF